MSTTHLITGVTGQDGVLLARLLLAEGGTVVGTHRPGSPAAAAMAPYLHGVELVAHDVRDQRGFANLVASVRPDEVYNLAAFSSVGQSWGSPDEALQVNGTSPEAMLDTLASLPAVRFLQAASSEETGDASGSPYARGKARAHEAVAAARMQGQFAVAAVLHIHESPIRRQHFVVRKITRGVAEIALGRRASLSLGQLDVRRDWGAAADHVRAMRLMMRADEPADFEVATGVVHALRDVVQMAFDAAGVNDPWSHVDSDDALYRPQDAVELVGDPDPLYRALGWQPTRTLGDVIAEMVAADLRRLATGVEEHERYLAAPDP